MAKSLTETAKQILMKESDDPTPDRGAKSMTPNMQTLHPGSRSVEGRFANPGSNAPGGAEAAEDLGPALVNNTDVPPSAKAAAKMGKDNSRSAQSAVPAEKPTQQASIMEDEEVEISEELEAFINEMIEEGYSEDEIAEAIAENFEIVEEKDEDEKEDEKEDKKEMDESSHMNKETMKEHVDALLAGENLSEDFRAKAETIFESAVLTRVQEEVSVLEEAYAKSLEEEVSAIMEQLTEQVDSYLSYVVEQWVAENEVAIETGLRTEITEEFISGLKTLFAENYIDVPEDKVSVVEELGSRVEALENQLNEEISKNVELTKTLNESLKHEIISNACEGLTNTEAEKLLTLAENVNFTSPDEFAGKVATLREGYFTKPVNRLDALDPVEPSDGKVLTEELSGPMAAYVRTLGKKLPR
jgi:hypothetical protein